MEDFQIFSDARKFYPQMIMDIKSAKKSVYLETYIYGDDFIGKRFRDVLVQKARQGVEVKILADAWGSKVRKDFFTELEKAGGQVRFFREIHYVIRILSKNHERNHKKLLLIDNEISYIGSANITADCLDWREIVLRLKGDITGHFVESFMHAWEAFGGITQKRFKSIIHKGFEIIQDIPSDRYKLTEKRYAELIKSARKKIMIETPYFVPPRRVRRALVAAVNRGVRIELILPEISDVRIIDIVRNRYFGYLYKKGLKIYYYKPKKLHSKLLIVDSKFFLLGSSNVDYRSFVHQYEINLLGRDKEIIYALKEYFNETLNGCKEFNYTEWRNRSSFAKILEMISSIVRMYL